MRRPQGGVIITLPFNGRERGNEPIAVDLDGVQTSIIRFYSDVEVDGERVPDYTHVLSASEERRYQSRRPYVFRGKLVEPSLTFRGIDSL